jgi:hypothetical protein
MKRLRAFLARDDADTKLVWNGMIALGFAFFAKFVLPFFIGPQHLVTWVMFIIATCLIAGGWAIGLARRFH